VPAFASVGILFTTMAIVAEEAVHGAFEIVHWKIFVPNPKPVTEVLGESELLITPVPEIRVHAPVPIIGALAAIIVLGEEIQSVCEVPALAVVGAGLIVIVTFELEGEQGELEIVQAKTFAPRPKPVIVVFGNKEFVITPAPETKAQEPVPVVGKFPFIVVDGEEIHSV